MITNKLLIEYLNILCSSYTPIIRLCFPNVKCVLYLTNIYAPANFSKDRKVINVSYLILTL